MAGGATGLPEEIEVKRHSMDEKSVSLISTQDPSSWKVYVDGAANQRGSRVGLVLVSLEKIIIEKSLRLVFGYKQQSKIRNFVDRNGDGPENGWKDSGDVLRFQTSNRSGKKGIRSSGCNNAGIFGSS